MKNKKQYKSRIESTIEKKFNVEVKESDFIDETVFMTYSAVNKQGVTIAKAQTLPELYDELMVQHKD
jgi:hypothetical protein